MRVCIAPFYKGTDQIDGGIRRVVEALVRYLPDFDIFPTDDPNAADLIHCHGTTLVERPGIPLIVSSHGLMWEDYGFGAWGDDVNAHCVEAMVRAQAVTAPSQWVGKAISRGLLMRPDVVYHGVDGAAWQTDEPALDYVLWNKARIDQVSDPSDMNAVARLLPDVRFIATFGQNAPNVLIVGPAPVEQMRSVVQRAAVYLATTRETFGIGTLEALAAGVPVAGWDYGGQSEIVIQGETGYLAPFGDLPKLAECIKRCIAERARLSTNAVEDARRRWQWQDKIAQYAALYRRVVEDWKRPRPKVSVVITAYNLAQYLPDALASVGGQTMTDWECIVVDDCSTDITAQVAQRYIQGWQGRGRYIRTPQNLGLSGARNYGWRHSTGKYVLFLDADDGLDQNALDILSKALDTSPGLHIAYGGLDTISADGSNRQRNPWPAGSFSWEGQLAHLNQLSYAALMRREVLERSGGFRIRDWRAEDAAFWSRVTSLGFRAARVTEDAVLIYRMHDDQKSKQERRVYADGDGDWVAWLPWRLTGDARAGLELMKAGKRANPRLTPFGAQGAPPAPLRAWPVRHFQHPVVSIVIPVGPGHETLLIDALDSVQSQTMPEWECLVVNDTGATLALPGHPWATVWEVNRIEGDQAVRMGAGAARNWGIRHAKAPLILCLDADDILAPHALETMLRAYVDSGGRYVYADCATALDERKLDLGMQTHEAPEYDQRRMLAQLYHAVTALVPHAWLDQVGLFNERLPIFEDWDLFAKLAATGYCGVRAPHPLLMVRREKSIRTVQAIEPLREGADFTTLPRYTPLGQEIGGVILDRYAPYLSGEEPLMACCGGNTDTVAVAQNALADMLPAGVTLAGALPGAVDLPTAGPVRMEFVGPQFGAQSYVGKSGTVYKGGREPGARFHDVDIRDVEGLLLLRDEGNDPMWRVVQPEILAAVAPAEAPAQPVVPAAAPPRVKGRRRSAD